MKVAVSTVLLEEACKASGITDKEQVAKKALKLLISLYEKQVDTKPTKPNAQNI